MPFYSLWPKLEPWRQQLGVRLQMGKRKRRGNNYCLEQTLWFRGAGDNGPLRRPPCTLLVQSSGQTSAPIQSWALGTRRYRHTAAGRVEVRGNLNKWDLTVHVERDWELMNLCRKQAEIQLGQRMRLVCHSHRELKGVCGKGSRECPRSGCDTECLKIGMGCWWMLFPQLNTGAVN